MTVNGASPGAFLCVDDESIILMHLLMLLRRRYGAGYRIEGVGDAGRGMAAVDRLYAEGFRVILVLTDWLMPGMKGDEFIRLVHARHPDIKAVVISGKTDPDSLEASLSDEGLVGFLPKPLVPDDLFHLIDGILAAEPAPLP